MARQAQVLCPMLHRKRSTIIFKTAISMDTDLDDVFGHIGDSAPSLPTEPAPAVDVEEVQTLDDYPTDFRIETSSTTGVGVVHEEWLGEHNCVHHCVRPVALKNGDPFRRCAWPNREPAKTYAYTLDAFQAKAVKCIEIDESVLVAAHTSAGKTTVAEYAISMSLLRGQRVIYTSPIKALSNQKYRDLCEEFDDVGLMTGDVTLNPNASVMVLTTEILRSMLYRGSELVKAVKWVVFDEVHYLRDKDRGVVWEESIILLPDEVRYVFLSATIPNAPEFAEWVCRIKKQACHTLYTDFRPTPLQHYIYPHGGDGLFLVVNEKKEFSEEQYARAIADLAKEKDLDQSVQKHKKRRTETNIAKTDLEKLVSMCHTLKYTPMIVFSFSKKEVEGNALAMKDLDLTSEEEKQTINVMFEAALATLNEEDHKLPQILSVKYLLCRGIGIHHGGLLPIVKEITEIMFQHSLVKVLFATETFAMGVNMPARTVIFSSLLKFDGSEKRFLLPGEYIQMSGRAGRRGIDDKGIVIVLMMEEVDSTKAKALFLGESLRLESQFRLTYNSVLNLTRIEGINVEYLCRRSFLQFSRDKQLERLKAKKKMLVDELEALEPLVDNVDLEGLPSDLPSDPEKLGDLAAEYYTDSYRLNGCESELAAIISQPVHAVKYVQRGRLFHIRHEESDYGVGLVLGSARQVVRTASEDERLDYVFDVLVETAPGLASGMFKPAPATGEGVWAVMKCNLRCIYKMSSVLMSNYTDLDLQNAEHRGKVGLQILTAIETKLKGSMPCLNPVQHMHITSEDCVALVDMQESTKKRLEANPLHVHPAFRKRLLDWVGRRVDATTLLRSHDEQLMTSSSVVLTDELRAMTNLLRRQDYLTPEGIVSHKGRIGCEISTANEIIVAELVFQNVLSDLEPKHLCALLSTLLYDEKNDEELPSDPILKVAVDKLVDLTRAIAQVATEYKICASVEEYVDSNINVGVAQAVMMWVEGSTFEAIMEAQTAYEGSVVRTIRRLEELLRQLATTSDIVGNKRLEEKLTNCSTLLRRGVVFAASLYL